MGDLVFRPDELNNGANAFDQHAEVLRGHAQQLDQLAAALPAAFAGAGMAALPGVQAKIDELRGHVENAHTRTTNAGSMLRTAATGSAEIDQQGGAALRM